MMIVSVCKMVAEVSKEVRKNEVTGVCVVRTGWCNGFIMDLEQSRWSAPDDLFKCRALFSSFAGDEAWKRMSREHEWIFQHCHSSLAVPPGKLRLDLRFSERAKSSFESNFKSLLLHDREVQGKYHLKWMEGKKSRKEW